MKRTAFMSLLLAALAVSSARAANPLAEDAAAVAAFFASSAPLLSTSVAVHEVEGPSPRAGAAAHALRAELFRLGVAVLQPDGPADYDLKGILSVEPIQTVWLNSLWRKSDGRLMAVYDRTLGGTAGPAKSASARPARRWRVSAGAHFRGRTTGWLAGAAWAWRDGRWEAGLDVGAFDIERGTHGTSSFTGNQFEVLHARLQASRLLPAAHWPRLEGWLPSKITFRGGLGLALYQVREEVTLVRPGTASAALARNPTTTTYLRPIFSGGARHGLTRRIALELGLEWVPDLLVPENMNLAGFGASARLLF